MAGQKNQAEAPLENQVDTVDSIRLDGAPTVLIVDPPALLSLDETIPPDLLAKLWVLANAGLQVAVVSTNRYPDFCTTIPGLNVVPLDEAANIPGTKLAIVGQPVSLPPDTVAWYVGTDSAPPSYRRSRYRNAAATNEILALYGTALVQERASIAFRAAGAGKPIPKDASFNHAILDGIARVVAPPVQASPSGAALVDLDREIDSLIAAALPPILACQTSTGAVAAAPRPTGRNEPDYWFFWQRDAAQVVLSLIHLAQDTTDPSIRAFCMRFVDGYLDFVEQLPRLPWMRSGDLGASRFEMDGHPIESYGNPQNDGPAQTVLAVLAALDDEDRAYRIAAPYLNYLVERIGEPSFDPWEFAAGTLFFDRNLARRALFAGCLLASRQGDDAAFHRYFRAAASLAGSVTSFIPLPSGYIRAGFDYLQPFINTISGLDVSVTGSILTAFDPADSVINVGSAPVAATMRALEDLYVDRWPVNIAWREASHPGMGIGRFPEDSNDGYGSTGGNPWSFTTLWAAQYYLCRIARYHYVDEIDGVRDAALLQKADGYLQFVLAHVSPSSVTEQIDGQTGEPRGAKQLAWGQAALIHTLLLRRDVKRKMLPPTPDSIPPGSR